MCLRGSRSSYHQDACSPLDSPIELCNGGVQLEWMIAGLPSIFAWMSCLNLYYLFIICMWVFILCVHKNTIKFYNRTGVCEHIRVAWLLIIKIKYKGKVIMYIVHGINAHNTIQS